MERWQWNQNEIPPIVVMQNELSSNIHCDYINNSTEYLNKNDHCNSNYQNLPLIMSSLNVNSTAPAPLTATTTVNLPPTVSTLASTSTGTSTTNNTTTLIPFSPNEIHTNFNSIGLSTKKRILPSRQAKESNNNSHSNLLNINRRTISKPKKFPIKELNLTPDAIRKLYIESGQKVTCFRSSNLETIFEEPHYIYGNDDDQQQQSDTTTSSTEPNRIQYLGKRKLKRSLSCSDGLNITKATIKSRRLRIKKTFGRRFALKKISLNDFYERLNSNMNDNLNDSHTNHNLINETPSGVLDNNEI